MTGIERTNHAHDVARIRGQNDAFRKTLRNGRLLVTNGVMEMTGGRAGDLIRAIADYEDFNSNNDPHGEHDFGQLSWQGESIFWKIDYYDKGMTFDSSVSTNRDMTARVMTVMMALEY
jgi:hypothetical protein